MSDETITTNTIKEVSDGTVKIAVEKYNELLETIANQKGSINGLNERLTRALNEPPVINRTVIHKTAEMAARDNRVWGGTLIALGASMLAVGVFRFNASYTES